MRSVIEAAHMWFLLQAAIEYERTNKRRQSLRWRPGRGGQAMKTLAPETLDAIYQRLAAGESRTAIAKDYDMSDRTFRRELGRHQAQKVRKAAA
jgi:hypothetical protein